MTKLLIATHNPGKLREFAALLAPYAQAVSLRDLGITQESPEDGETFVENAAQKALFYARLTNLPTLADDSGLCVDALGGAPGVRSARYSGGGDGANNALLLQNLAGQPNRAAHFSCALCLALPSGQVHHFEGRLEGEIAAQPAGRDGFGYDPIFLVGNQTLAQMPAEDKNKISHRGRAINALITVLAQDNIL